MTFVDVTENPEFQSYQTEKNSEKSQQLNIGPR